MNAQDNEPKFIGDVFSAAVIGVGEWIMAHPWRAAAIGLTPSLVLLVIEWWIGQPVYDVR